MFSTIAEMFILNKHFSPPPPQKKKDDLKVIRTWNTWNNFGQIWTIYSAIGLSMTSNGFQFFQAGMYTLAGMYPKSSQDSAGFQAPWIFFRLPLHEMGVTSKSVFSL